MLEEGSDQLPKVGELGTTGGWEDLIFDIYSFSKNQFDTPSELEVGSDQLPKVGELGTTAGREDLFFDNFLFSKEQFDTPSRQEEGSDQLPKVGEPGTTEGWEDLIFEIYSDSEEQSETLSTLIGKYIQELKSIPLPRIDNIDLINGVDRVSHSIAECIELAKSALQHHKTDDIHQKSEELSPRLDRPGDIFSGFNRVDSSLADCIKLAEATLHPQKESPESVFGREFYNFMDGLDHLDPIDDLKQWSDNINEFMEGLCTPLSPYLVDDPWQQPDPVDDYQQ